jgi:hypothetical protein
LELGGCQVPGPASGGDAKRQPDREGGQYEGGRLPGYGGGDLLALEPEGLQDGEVAAPTVDKDRDRVADGDGAASSLTLLFRRGCDQPPW